MARATRLPLTRSDDGTPRPSRPGSAASTARGSPPCGPAMGADHGSTMALTRSNASWPNGPARPSAAGADGAAPRPRAGAGGRAHLVLDPAAESLAPGSRRAAQGQHVHDLAHPARGRPELAEEPHLVRNRRGDAQAQTRWRGARQRSRCHGQKKLIEQAYTLGAQLGLSVWCEDEAGPFQAVPHPGTSWQPRGQPALQPHEYIRGGTTKILTLFHPASGRVRLQPAARCTNAVLHPWLRERLSAILAELPPRGPSQDPAVTRAAWAVWQAGLTRPFTLPHALRLLLVWDNLA